MQELFRTLTQAMQAQPAVALTAAFVWGILSVILSPCHLASIPLIVGYVDKHARASVKRALIISTLFALGILITVALVGAVTALAGRMAGDLGAYANYVVAAIFFLAGLYLLDVIPLPWSGPGQVNVKRKGIWTALLLGLIFGVALGPCTFAYMAPILAVTFRLASDQLAYAITLLAAYGLGHCLVIAAAGAAAGFVQRYLDWNERSRGSILLRRLCGVGVILGGLYLVYVA